MTRSVLSFLANSSGGSVEERGRPSQVSYHLVGSLDVAIRVLRAAVSLGRDASLEPAKA